MHSLLETGGTAVLSLGIGDVAGVVVNVVVWPRALDQDAADAGPSPVGEALAAPFTPTPSAWNPYVLSNLEISSSGIFRPSYEALALDSLYSKVLLPPGAVPVLGATLPILLHGRAPLGLVELSLASIAGHF